MLIAFNKPYGILSQFTPEPGSKYGTLASFGFPQNVYPIGRLDADSEGLLLLSDEKGLNKALLEPSAAHKRTYYVQVEGTITNEAIALLEHGVEIRIPSSGNRNALYSTLPCRALQIEAPPLEARVPPIRERKNIPTSWVQLELVEGKNRQVRRMLAAVGFPVLRLLRMRIGAYGLGDLSVGSWRELSVEERRLLLRES